MHASMIPVLFFKIKVADPLDMRRIDEQRNVERERSLNATSVAKDPSPPLIRNVASSDARDEARGRGSMARHAPLALESGSVGGKPLPSGDGTGKKAQRQAGAPQRKKKPFRSLSSPRRFPPVPPLPPAVVILFLHPLLESSSENPISPFRSADSLLACLLDLEYGPTGGKFLNHPAPKEGIWDMTGFKK